MYVRLKETDFSSLVNDTHTMPQGNRWRIIIVAGAALVSIAFAQNYILPKLDPNLYKWRDKNGVIHYGDTPPAHVKILPMRPDAKVNVVSTQEAGGKQSQTKADPLEKILGKGYNERLDPDKLLPQ